MNYFIYTSHHFTPLGRYELNKLPSLPTCGFIAQLVEHRTGIAEVTGSNPVEALIFSGFFPIASIGNLLRWSFFTLIYNRSSNIWFISYILHIISLLLGDMNSINWPRSQRVATCWERGQFIEFISPKRSEMMWSIYEIIHIFELRL